MFSRFLILVIIFNYSLNKCAFADSELALLQQKYPSVSANTYLSLPRSADLQGWDNLVIKLAASGVPKDQLLNIYSSKNFPQFETVYFGLNPGESKNLYRGIVSSANANKVKAFITENKSVFSRAEREFGVNPEIIASLLFIESRFGANTGKSPAIYRLSRLANISDPNNLRANYVRAKKMHKTATLDQVLKRAHYLEDTFLPEVAALFKIAAENNIAVKEIQGSSAGAFGWPQFLPTSYLKYSVDYDGDGKRSLHSKADAIGSVAKYLSHNGWKKGISLKEKRAVIWTYNKSNPYIDAALNLAARAV